MRPRASELPRILLPRTPVNKGDNKGRALLRRLPLPGIQSAHSWGVADGKIGVLDTLNDLVKELGLEDEMRRRERMRKARGAEPLEGMQLASL